MVDFAKPYVELVEMVTAFSRDPEMRRKQFTFEDSMRPIFNGGAQQIQLGPHPTPGNPRFIFNQPPKTCIVSEVQAGMTVSYIVNRSNPNILGPTSKDAKIFDSAVSSVVSRENVKFSGLVIVIKYPSSSSVTDIQRLLYARFIKLSPLGPIASAQVALGFELNGYNVIYSNYAYNTNTVMTDTPSDVLHVDQDQVDVGESGLLLRIDVNSRPQINLQTANNSVHELVEIMRSAIDVQFDSIFGDIIQKPRIS